MGRLDDAYARRIALLSELDRRQQQLLQVAQNYASLLDRRLLWIPDVDPLGPAWLRAWPAALHELLQPARWAELPAALVTVLATRPLAALGLLLPLVLFALRGRLRHRQQADAVRLIDIHRDSAWFTALALGYAALRVLPWPLLMYLLGRLLASDSPDASFVDASAGALSGMAPAVFVLGFIREIARQGGVLEAHYQWQAQARQILRRQVARLRLVLVPAGLLVIFTERLGQTATRATVGRLAFVVFSMGLAAFLWQTLHPQRGAPAAYLAPGGTAGCGAGAGCGIRWRRPARCCRRCWPCSVFITPPCSCRGGRCRPAGGCWACCWCITWCCAHWRWHSAACD